ncbi:MAG: sirohydrochlorin chelatase [Actinomycetales bacterium]|nr:sirohydrochlorin chelatase [Actinomycetales bacterium]
MSASPVLIGCSHGTDSVAGRAAIRSILDDVRALRPELDVREAFVDVQLPEVADVVGEALSDGGGAGSEEGSRGSDAGPVGAVVVPLLLSTGFHVKVDIADSVAGRPAVAARPMGPHPLLVDILVDRLAAVALTPADAVVLASAGSTDPDAAVHVRKVAAGLAAALGRPVAVGYGAGAHPRVPAAVSSAREALPPGGRVVVASYLLAPGYFHDRVLEAGADVVTTPLAPDPRLAQITLERYAEA